MIYICVRTYGNGKYMNKVYNVFFEWLSQAENMAGELNKMDCDNNEKWICIPLNKYVESVQD